MAQIQLRLMLRRLQTHADLRRRIVQHQLVIAAAAILAGTDFLRLEAGENGIVAIADKPGRRVAGRRPCALRDLIALCIFLVNAGDNALPKL